MIASLLLSACLLAAPTPDQPTTQTAGQTTKAAPAQKAAPKGAPAQKAVPPAPKAAPAPAAKAAPAAKPATGPAADAPKGLVVVETTRGKLEFSHKAHADTACADCHKGQAVPARIGVKGIEAAHKFCVDCHKAGKKGPEKCSWCHTRP